MTAPRATDSNSPVHAAAESVLRHSYGKLIAFLSARTHDLASAEDALSEAFAAALSDWPRNGIPDNPEAWLLTVARRKSIDAHRTQHRHELAADQGKILSEGLHSAEAEVAANHIPDQRLALMFACAHPAIDPAMRAPLILQTILGLDAARIASAFLISPATMSQRLVRAKNKIHVASIPFRIPERDDLRPLLSSVLDAIYAAFSEGWSDPSGTDSARRDLAEEAIFLCRVVAQLLPTEPEALGLLALQLHAEARRPARRSAEGDYVPLADQDPAKWNASMIDEAESLLLRASQAHFLGRYQLEAALQSAHAHRRRTGIDNWRAILELYDALEIISPSPVVAINRALAIAELEGPSVALKALDAVATDHRLAQYQPYWAARADLLARQGGHHEAHTAYDRAIGLAQDPAIRRFLLRRQSQLSL